MEYNPRRTTEDIHVHVHLEGLEQIMSSIADLQARDEARSQQIAALSSAVSQLVSLVQSLQAQLQQQAGTVLSAPDQAALDNSVAAEDADNAVLASLVSQVEAVVNPAPAPEPQPAPSDVAPADEQQQAPSL